MTGSLGWSRKAQTEVCATVYESVNVDQHDLGQGQLAELAVGRPYAVYREVKIPNVEETEDPGRIFTAQFIGGLDVW